MFSVIRNLAVTIIAIWTLFRLSASLIPAAIGVTALVMHKKGKNKEPESPIVKFWLDSLNEGQMDQVEDYIAPNFVWYVNHVEVQRSSPDEDVYQLYRENVAFIRNLLPDVEVSLNDEVIGENAIAVRCGVTGTHTGELPGIPATGNEVEWDQVIFFYTADNKMVELTASFNSEHWLTQLGVVPAP